MDSRNPDELISEVKEEQQTRGELATEALQWFLDDNVGKLFPRSGAVDILSNELDITNRQANTAISDTVGDIVDPVQQIVKGNKKYVGVIDYKVFSDEGAYGYVDFNDRKGKRKRVVCARCVEKHTYDENVIHATQGEGTSNLDATWQQLLNKVTSHYTTQHNTKPSNVEPGASLVNGTTISGNTAFHQGNLADRGAVNITPSTNNQTIPEGFHNGSGVVQGDGSLAASNIKDGVNIFGVTGNVDAFVPLEEQLINSGSGTDIDTFYNNNLATFDKFTNNSSDAQDLANSPLGMAFFSLSQPAADDLANSSTAMQEIANSQIAMELIAKSTPAINKIESSQTAMQEIAGSSTAMNQIASSQAAMSKVSTSNTAMQEIVSSQTAMQEVAESGTAMQEIAESQTAMQLVAESQTAINEIGSNANENITKNTVLNSSTSTSELVNSNLVEFVSRNFLNGTNANGSITNERVLVVSNNNNGFSGSGINYANDVGPETQNDSTFIINGANANPGNNQGRNTIGFDGIIIE